MAYAGIMAFRPGFTGDYQDLDCKLRIGKAEGEPHLCTHVGVGPLALCVR